MHNTYIFYKYISVPSISKFTKLEINLLFFMYKYLDVCLKKYVYWGCGDNFIPPKYLLQKNIDI